MFRLGFAPGTSIVMVQYFYRYATEVVNCYFKLNEVASITVYVVCLTTTLFDKSFD